MAINGQVKVQDWEFLELPTDYRPFKNSALIYHIPQYYPTKNLQKNLVTLKSVIECQNTRAASVKLRQIFPKLKVQYRESSKFDPAVCLKQRNSDASG